MKKEQKIHSDGGLRSKEKEILENSSGESEFMKVIQELSAHQIELEMKNEELVEARKSEREIKEKYIQLYDFAPSGYLTLNREGRIIELNLMAAKMLGRERSLLLNAGFTFFVITRARSLFMDFLSKVLESNMNQTCEVTLETGYDILLTGISNNDTVNLTAIDISNLKKVEEEKSRLLDEVNESRRKIDLILQNAKIGSWEYDRKTGRILMDGSLAEILGIEKMNISDDEFQDLLHIEDVPNLRITTEEAFEKKIPFETFFRIRHHDEKIKYLTAKAFINYDRDNDVAGLSGVCIDMTDSHESFEHSLITLNNELTESNKNLKNFAYIASHDLQEPLRMVTCFVQLLEKKYGSELDDTAREYIAFAVQGAKRMYDLLNSLLAYSRLSTKPSFLQEVDMNEILDTVRDNMQLMIREKQARLESDKLPVIYADYNQMIQLLQNLIDNGIKFSNTAPRIKISSTLEGNFHIFKVEDSGIGIEHEYFDKIFIIFQKLHNCEKYPGTGIGLAICKSIVERHGGSIWLDSKPGEGTTFFFSIPVNQQNSV